MAYTKEEILKVMQKDVGRLWSPTEISRKIDGEGASWKVCPKLQTLAREGKVVRVLKGRSGRMGLWKINIAEADEKC